ncbi:TPA: fimbrial protein [Escherichia coli]
MRFSKIAIMTFDLLIVGMLSPVYAASTATATLIVEATFTKPTCSIHVPPDYNLGKLVRGQVKKHEPLLIIVKCPDTQSVKTALTAKVLTGSLESTQDKVRMMVNGKKSGALLSLKTVNTGSSARIKLTGAAQDAFCDIDNGRLRQCQLIPITEVRSGGKLGPASATIQFEVVYP